MDNIADISFDGIVNPLLFIFKLSEIRKGVKKILCRIQRHDQRASLTQTNCRENLHVTHTEISTIVRFTPDSPINSKVERRELKRE